MPCDGCNKSMINRIVTMAKGGYKLALAKSGLRVADDRTIDERKSLCLSCEHYDFGVCQKCECFLAAKVSLPGEKCPEGKW